MGLAVVCLLGFGLLFCFMDLLFRVVVRWLVGFGGLLVWWFG